MKSIRLQFNKRTSQLMMFRQPKVTSTAKQNDKEMDGGDLLFSRTATAPTTGITLSKLRRSSSSIHPNLRSMCIRNSSRSLSRAASDSSPLSFIEEPLCAYLSLFDGSKQDMTDVHIQIIDNLFSDNFVHMMDGNTPIDKLTFVQINKQMLKQGIVATLEDINFVDEYNLEYTVHWYCTENSSRVTHVSALVVDQKIVKLEPCVETRSAFANNMTFSSWREGAKGNDRVGSSSSSSDSTASTIEESLLHNITTTPSKLDHDHEENKKALAQENTELQDNNKCEGNSTTASVMDEELLLDKFQELEAVHNEDYASHEIGGKPSCDGVNPNDDERRINRGNGNERGRSTKQLKVKRRWFRVGRQRKKKQGNSHDKSSRN
ncbi:hypothetical protein ACHAWT_007780 [Skeletonema menzelii]